MSPCDRGRLFCPEGCRFRHQGIGGVTGSNSAVRGPYHISNSVNATQTENGISSTVTCAAPQKALPFSWELTGESIYGSDHFDSCRVRLRQQLGAVVHGSCANHGKANALS